MTSIDCTTRYLLRIFFSHLWNFLRRGLKTKCQCRPFLLLNCSTVDDPCFIIDVRVAMPRQKCQSEWIPASVPQTSPRLFALAARWLSFSLPISFSLSWPSLQAGQFSVQFRGSTSNSVRQVCRSDDRRRAREVTCRTFLFLLLILPHHLGALGSRGDFGDRNSFCSLQLK